MLKTLQVCSFFLLFSMAPSILFAQTATIAGTVTDSSDAGVSEAKVTAKSIETGATREIQTNDSGGYTLSNLRPGKYDVTIEKEGFAKTNYSAVQLTVAQALTLNAKLEVGQFSQSVSVEGATVAPVELENGQISNIVDSRRILDLPLLTRDPYSLILLSPGVTSAKSDLGGFSVNGSRERNNNFLLDGVDNNDASVPGIPGGTVTLNPDAIQEFRTITNNFLAEYGRNTGGIVDIISRSGTNEVHGTAYWFGRYDALGARDYFNTKPNPQDPYVRNIFGWALGAPIKKDKTFFFFNNEYQRFRTTVQNTSTVPTADFRTGIFNYNGFPVNLRNPGSPNNAQGLSLDPTVQRALALLPTPNGEAVDDVRGIYRFASPSRLNSANVNFKLDHRFTEKHSFFARYSYNGSGDSNPFHDEFAPGLGVTGIQTQTHAIATNLVSTFTPSIVNEFRAGVNRADVGFPCAGTDRLNSVGQIDQFGVGGDYALSGIAQIGCFGLGNSNGQARRAGTWSINDGLTWIKGNHTMKFGGEFRYVFNNGFNAFNSRTLYDLSPFSNYNLPIVNLNPAVPCDPTNVDATCGGRQFQDLAGGLLGFVGTQSQNQYFDRDGNRTPLDYRRYVQHEYGAYIQDAWKIRPNLTLNYGIRYQFNGVPFERDGNLSNLFTDPAGFAPITFSLVGPGSGNLLYQNNSNLIEPRFGFSWDPTSKGKTAIRGGYGIFHDRIFGNLFGNSSSNPPFQQNYFDFPRAQLSTLGLAPTLQTSLTVQDGAFISVSLIDPKLRIPTSQNWNFGIQQELPGSTTVEVNYIGSKGSNILRVVNGSQALPSVVNQLIADGTPEELLQSTALYTQYPTVNNTALFQPGVNKSIANSTFHSMQVRATRRLSHGVQIQAAYSWSHAIDDASDPIVPGQTNRSFPRNSFNLRGERGNADFDQRQRLVLNYVVELPFGKGRALFNQGLAGRLLEGWQVTGISTFEDGLPYDILTNRDSEHTGVGSRAQLIGDPSIPSGSSRAQTGPPVSAFGDPPFGSPGNVGRNAFVGPGILNTDATLSKYQSITERVKLQLRFEFFNLFNRTRFRQPGNSIFNPGTFGLSTRTVLSPDSTTTNRQIQLALKLIF